MPLIPSRKSFWALGCKAIPLFTFTLGVRTPRWQQIAEAGWLWTGHHCRRAPVHGLWHPNIRGSRDHRGNWVSASVVDWSAVLAKEPVCFRNRRKPPRPIQTELAVRFLATFFFFNFKLRATFSVSPVKLPITAILFKASTWPLLKVEQQLLTPE